MSDKKELKREVPVRAVRVYYLCENCGGSMVATKFQPYMDGVQHTCENNDSVAVLDRAYPYIDYRALSDVPTRPLDTLRGHPSRPPRSDRPNPAS